MLLSRNAQLMLIVCLLAAAILMLAFLQDKLLIAEIFIARWNANLEH